MTRLPLWVILIFVAFLAVLAVLLKKALGSSEKGLDRKARKLAEDGRFQEAARLLIDANRAADAIKLLLEYRRSDEAARVYLHQGDYANAARLFAQIGEHEAACNAWIKAGNIKEAARATERLKRFEQAGDLYTQAGDLQDALRCYEEVKQYRKAGDLYMKTGDKKTASQYLARHHTAQGEWEEAAKYWMQAGKQRNAAEALYRAGRFQAAAKLFEHLGEFRYAAKALMRMGDSVGAAANLEKTGDLAAALYLYESGGQWNKVIEIHKRQKNWGVLGNIMMRLDKLDLAAEFFKRISPLEENYVECGLSLASILESQGDQKEAVKKYCEILEFKGVNQATARALFSLCSLAEKTNQPKVVLPYLQRINTSGPMGEKVKKWLERMEHLVMTADMTLVANVEVATEEEAKAGKIAFNLPKRDSLADRYNVVDKIGQGGHGVIYKAFDKTLAREVVLKFLFKNQLPDDLAIRYFLREAKTMAGLNHPNIVTLFEMGEVSGNMYLAMEYIKGMDLERRLLEARGPLPFTLTCKLVTQMADALQYAHDKTVIHRDIKPGNIMLTGPSLDKVKLMDFGLAKALDENPTKTLIVCGTPLYMSPEQIAGDFVDHRSDIYSFAVVVFQLLTGATPFPAANILAHHQFTPPPHPTSLNKDVPVEVAEVVLKALEKQREQRYQRVNDFAKDLVAAFSDKPEDKPDTERLGS